MSEKTKKNRRKGGRLKNKHKTQSRAYSWRKFCEYHMDNLTTLDAQSIFYSAFNMGFKRGVIHQRWTMKKLDEKTQKIMDNLYGTKDTNKKDCYNCGHYNFHPLTISNDAGYMCDISDLDCKDSDDKPSWIPTKEDDEDADEGSND